MIHLHFASLILSLPWQRLTFGERCIVLYPTFISRYDLFEKHVPLSSKPNLCRHIATRVCFCSVVSVYCIQRTQIFQKCRLSRIICLTIPYAISTAAAISRIVRIIFDECCHLNLEFIGVRRLQSATVQAVFHICSTRLQMVTPLKNMLNRHCRIPIQIFKMWENLFGWNSFEI